MTNHDKNIRKSCRVRKTALASAIATMLFSTLSGNVLAAPAHDKNVIGYITQWEAWKDAQYGFSVKGEATHLNVDMDIYSILNFSFFGVAKDGSLHSGDLRNRKIYEDGAVQEPGDLLMTDVYSSWDLHILWGELEYLYDYPGDADWEADKLARVQAQGFVKSSKGWRHEPSGLEGAMPIPLKKEGGAPGLIDLAHQNGVKVMASLGGWSMSKHFPEMAADAAKKARFLEDIDKLMALGFDGIDIDWEYPGYGGMNFPGSEADYANFEQLMEDIRERIGADKLITAAFSASTAKLEGYNWPRLAASMDYFNMMTYDLNGGWSNVTGHNSPLFPYPEQEWDNLNLDTLRAFMAQRNIPSNKINFGAAFYGRGVQTTEANAYLGAPTDKRTVNFAVDGPTSSASDMDNFGLFEGQPNYNYLVKQTGWEHRWDASAEVPYALKGKYFLSYDDVPSIEKKAQYIVDNNLAGVIVWQVAGDIKCEGTFISHGTKLKECTNLSSPLAEAIDRVFSDGVVPNAAPELTVPGNQNADSSAVITFVVSATDADSDPLSFTVSGEGATVTDNGDGTATVTYQAPATTVDLAETVNVTVSDGRKQVSKSVVINVRGSGVVENIPPVLTAPASVSVDSGAVASIAVSASDADNDALTFTASQGTVAASGNSATVSVTAPTTTTDTTVSVTVTVSDGNGGTDSQVVTVNVTGSGGTTGDTWDVDTVYLGGDTVIYGGVQYTAKYWTQGNKPDSSDAWEAYDDGSVQEWSATKTYNGGDQATYNGQTYQANYWTKGNNPAENSGPGQPWSAI